MGINITDNSFLTRHLQWTSRSLLRYTMVLTAFIAYSFGSSECGDFYQLKTDTVGNIYSPLYPNPYTTYSKCIWVFKTNADSLRVQLQITYTGERYAGNCADYLEVRDGSEERKLLGTYCDNHTSEVVTSTSRWLWVKFQSDGINGNASVMHAQFSAVVNNTPVATEDSSDPIESCRSYQFQCRNSICLSMSYRCDGYNDCGCLKDCDEDGCGGLNISKGAQIGIAIGVGVGAFIVVCFIAFVMEGKNSWVTSQQSEAIRAKGILEEERRRRASRAFTKFMGDKDVHEDLFKGAPSLANLNLNARTPTLTVTDFD